ncbi:MAG: GNAT family N-acetyltransferase [Rhodospirillaceae bacterium]|nr:GNAT family N-acetyltransferase [Rhodospirillaceae bacterium]
MSIVYRHDVALSPAQYVDVLNRSTLGARRPVKNLGAIADMLAHANILITAWDGDQLVGVARSMSDMAYVTYLADLAVDQAYQRRGIGRRLIAETQARARPTCKILLFAAPSAEGYYGHVGLIPRTEGWVLPAQET